MSTASRITSTQLGVIQDGCAIRQTWTLGVPTSSSHSGYSNTLLDTGIFSGPSPTLERVIKAGSRKHQVWNPSPQVKVKPKAVRYSFVVDNSDGRFFENSSDNFYNYASGVYQATPQECLIYHKIFVWHAAQGVWTELTNMAYTGRIMELRHEDTANAKGEIVGAQTVITCEQVGAWEALRRVWTIDDGVDVPMTNGAVDITWTI